jgi:ribulose-5-phosphate 4-epimerase/fuculose-1-phosphate aldolase
VASSNLSLKNEVSSAEWEARVNLAAAYRLVALFGWDDLVFTHISARVPGPEHHFLINPYGLMFDEITASSLVKVDLNGRKVVESPYDVNPAGFTIHSAVHAAREDALCVMHTHSVNGVAVSAQEAGLLPLSQQSLGVLASLGYHDYEGIALNEAEKPRLVRDLGSNTYLFEASCMIQVRAQSGGAKLTPIPQSILAGIKEQIRAVTSGTPGALAWPGLLRRLDRRSPGYAD